MAENPINYKSLVELYNKNKLADLSNETKNFLNKIVAGQNAGVYASKFDEHMRWDNPAENHPQYDYYRILKSIMDEYDTSKQFFQELFSKWNKISNKKRYPNFKKEYKEQIDNVIESLRDPSNFKPDLFIPVERDNKMSGSMYNRKFYVLKNIISKMIFSNIRLKEIQQIFPEIEIKQDNNRDKGKLAELLASYIWVNDKFRNSVLVDLYSNFSK